MTTDTATQTDTPRAWVGCLGCYNSGSLVGKWLEGESCADLAGAGLADTDERCLKCGGDEFMVFDHENYCGVLKGEVSPQEAADAAELLNTVPDYEREILIAWLGNGMEFDLDAMREAYIGEYSSDRDMAENFADDTGLFSGLRDPEREFCERYFDYDAYARDLMNDIFDRDGHYFWSY